VSGIDIAEGEDLALSGGFGVETPRPRRGEEEDVVVRRAGDRHRQAAPGDVGGVRRAEIEELDHAVRPTGGGDVSAVAVGPGRLVPIA
jgi:hypothetical protein